jgi:hypothetical protein
MAHRTDSSGRITDVQRTDVPDARTEDRSDAREAMVARHREAWKTDDERRDEVAELISDPRERMRLRNSVAWQMTSDLTELARRKILIDAARRWRR